MQAISAATATLSSNPAIGSVDPRLAKAAHEFEAQMMKELLKPMTGKDALTGEDAADGGDANSEGALGEFASEALGQALSMHGGFGIANSIIHDLSHSGKQGGSGKETGNLHANTVIKPLK
jgi:Rod binding domain-containing protein